MHWMPQRASQIPLVKDAQLNTRLLKAELFKKKMRFFACFLKRAFFVFLGSFLRRAQIGPEEEVLVYGKGKGPSAPPQPFCVKIHAGA